MFELPSMLNLVISTIVFFVAAWYIRRYLEEQGIDKGMMRGVLVFVLASTASWGAGELVDWVQGPQPPSQIERDLSQMMKATGQVQP